MRCMELKFQKAIKHYRINRGFTQEEIAEAANINDKYYGRIERGESSPTLSTFFCLCNALDTSPKKFMEFMEKIEIEK